MALYVGYRLKKALNKIIFWISKIKFNKWFGVDRPVCQAISAVEKFPILNLIIIKINLLLNFELFH